MPLYDYRCTACHREVEVMHGIYESGPTKCEHCGGAMRKALSAPAIHFKGRGWAKKDAASAAAKKAQPKDSTKDAPDTPKGEDKAAPADTGKKDSGSKSEPASGSETKASPATSSTSD